MAIEKALFNVQEAFYGLFNNFPVKFTSGLIKFICFPLGRPVAQPSDQLKRQVAESMMQENTFRDQLKQHVFYSTKANDIHGRMESTFLMLLEIEPLWNKFKKAESDDQFTGLTFEEHIQSALEASFINQTEADQLLTYNAKRFDSMLTDIFDAELNQSLTVENPHLPPT